MSQMDTKKRSRAKRSAVPEVADNIMRWLDENDWSTERKLPTERELAQISQSSRNTVRKALQLLEQEQKIRTAEGRGYLLASSSTQSDIFISPVDVLDVRLALEPGLAGLLVGRANNSVFDALQKAQRGCELAQTVQEFELWDARFHTALVEGTGNQLIIELYKKVSAARDQTEWGRLKALSLNKERRENYLKEHQAIIDALLARDREGASLALRQHVLSVRNNMLES